MKWIIGDETVLRWYDMMHESPQQSTRAVGELVTAAAEGNVPEGLSDPEATNAGTKDIWNTQLSILDRYNEPGIFSAIAGYEWTAMPQGNNLHRVVMFRDGSDKTRQTTPFPGLSTTAPQLWDYMKRYEADTGGRVLAIPHNANLSNGLMFQMTMEDGSPMTPEYAALRAWAEPVIEATQIKGDSETHPFLSPNDEMAGFGVTGWDFGNLSLSEETVPSMYAGSYARSALLRGLTLETQLGVNPYAFGMIGSTDSHTSLATGDEDNFWGKHTGNEQAYTRPFDECAKPRNATRTLRLALSGRRLRGSLGARQHARGDLRRLRQTRGLCHHGAADDGARVRRLRLFGSILEWRLGPRGLHQRGADGRRATGRGARTNADDQRAERRRRREPRPRAGDQGGGWMLRARCANASTTWYGATCSRGPKQATRFHPSATR